MAETALVLREKKQSNTGILLILAIIALVFLVFFFLQIKAKSTPGKISMPNIFGNFVQPTPDIILQQNPGIKTEGTPVTNGMTLLEEVQQGYLTDAQAKFIDPNYATNNATA